MDLVSDGGVEESFSVKIGISIGWCWYVVNRYVVGGADKVKNMAAVVGGEVQLQVNRKSIY